MAVTDYATVPHYFLPPEDASEETVEFRACAAEGCGEVPLDPIHTEPDGTYSGVMAAPTAEFGDHDHGSGPDDS